MSSICEACNGEGIVGNGERPTDKVGRLTTCSVCAGTGKSVDGEVTSSAPEEVVEPSSDESFLVEPSEDSVSSSEDEAV